MKVSSKIENIKDVWDENNTNDFIHSSFLEIFCKNHPNIKHLFIFDKDLKLYANIIKLNFGKTKKYLKNTFLRLLIKRIHFDILYLTNTFITNIPAFITNKKINLDKLLSSLKHNYSLLVIPDFVFKSIVTKNHNFIKVEVEEDMALTIAKDWVSVNDYIASFKKKYRNKIKKALVLSEEVEIKILNYNEIKKYSKNINDLFFQVISESKFNGPLFNTASFLQLSKRENFKFYGYFIKKKLVAFSSEIHQGTLLYSYYVGINKHLNKSKAIYSKILIETINHAIKNNMKKVVFGRTANEFKSNFGAEPRKSYVYINVKNKFLSILITPILNRLSVKKWTKRKPFKAEVYNL